MATMDVPFPEAQSTGEEKIGPKEKYNLKQYRGLVDHVVTIRDGVEKERRLAAETEEALRLQIKDRDSEAKAVQKELSTQLRVAGRSYEQLLAAMRELQDQLRLEKERARDEAEPLYAEIKVLNKKLSVIEKPWKEEVAKRDLKILKLQEMIPPLEQKIREEKMKLPPVIEKFKEEIKLREDATESVLKEIKFIQAENERKQEEALDLLRVEKERAAAEIKPVQEELEEVKAILATATDPFKKEIKELNKTIAGLQKEIDAVDYSPYEKNIEIREQAYAKLVRDFEVKTVYNREMLDKMRENYEAVITRMDKKMVAMQRGQEDLVKPYIKQVEEKDAEIERHKKRMEEFKKKVAENTKREEEAHAITRKELDAAKEAVEKSFQELTTAKRQLAAGMEELEGDNGPWKRMRRLEMKLEDVTQKCQALVKQRDRELAEKSEIITNLQKRMREEAEKFEDLDRMWDKRVQVKEDGYKRVAGELAYAEGQIIEERKRTAMRIREVKAREQDIIRLKEEHTEELKLRLEDREQLEAFIKELELARLGDTVQYEERIQYLEADNVRWRQRGDADKHDLMVEVNRRDKARAIIEAELAKIRTEYDKARVSWDDKERELEIFIRNRDRHITALKNEIEFINDSWEIKYNNLMNLFEKLQKKYDEVVGPNGINELQRRVKDLKEEVLYLNNHIEDLKEQLKKQKRRIRDLELDIDGVMKETADILNEKERGIANMVNDYTKLENRYREQTLLMERLLKEADAAKVEIVNSFQLRIDQLEQLVESMRFTDRQELVDQIDVWKKAYSRVCIQRDDIEDELSATLDIKEHQVAKMAEENNEVRDAALNARVTLMQEMDALDEEWKKRETMWHMEKADFNKRIQQLELDLMDMKRRAENAALTHDVQGDDDEKEELKRIIAQKDLDIGELEKGIPMIVEENRRLMEKVQTVDAGISDVHGHYEPIIAEKDRTIAKMAREHDELKEILEIEMYKAQEACRAIVENVKKFPNPFEIEVKEMRDKYAQMQSGMVKMNLENIQLRESFRDIVIVKDEEIKELEQQLETAAKLLKDVSGIGIIQTMAKGLSKKDANKLETAMGIDLDGDGKIGNSTIKLPT